MILAPNAKHVSIGSVPPAENCGVNVSRSTFNARRACTVGIAAVGERVFTLRVHRKIRWFHRTFST
jgi:hypothetical protein